MEEDTTRPCNKMISEPFQYHNELLFYCSREKFKQSLIRMGDWIHEARVQKLTTTVLLDPTDRNVAREILIEFLSTYRKTRLRHLLDYINEVIPILFSG